MSRLASLLLVMALLALSKPLPSYAVEELDCVEEEMSDDEVSALIDDQEVDADTRGAFSEAMTAGRSIWGFIRWMCTRPPRIPAGCRPHWSGNGNYICPRGNVYRPDGSLLRPVYRPEPYVPPVVPPVRPPKYGPVVPPVYQGPKNPGCVHNYDEACELGLFD